MKINEIISEHLTINPSSKVLWITSQFTKEFLAHGIKLPMPLKMSYGDFEILKWGNSFAVVKNSEIYLFLGLALFSSNIWQMKKFERVKDPTKDTRDMAAALFHYIILDLRTNLLSDETMSDAGEQFWKSQIHRKQVPIFIYDAFTEECYDLNQVGELTMTEPKTKIKSPEDDLGWNDSSATKKYRWFWLASTLWKYGSHYLREEIENGREPEWVLFGEQNYPNEIR